MRNKGFAPIIILLILVVVALMGVAYLAGSQGILTGNVPLISSSPSPKVVADSTIDWKTYSDPNKVYEFKYPPNYFLGHYSGDNSPLLLNNRIDWGVTQHAGGGCIGDCPVITSKSESSVNNYKATIYKGWIGSVGGETPQSFIKYEIQGTETVGIEGPNYFVITLWELDRTSAAQGNYSQTRNVGEIGTEDIKIFEQILSTFKFTQ